MSILIVEDDKTSPHTIALTLKRYGYAHYMPENDHCAPSTRMDRPTYAELVKGFKPLLIEHIALLETHVKKMAPMRIDLLDHEI
jgi:hypothetical protein